MTDQIGVSYNFSNILFILFFSIKCIFRLTLYTPTKSSTMKALRIFLIFIFAFHAKSHCSTIKIIDAGSFYFTSDSSWYQIAVDMGHTASINPLSTLNDTSFYATTDILIVSGGTISYSTLQINNILGFIKRGKSVYLQAEYLISFSANTAFKYLIEELGGEFDWISHLTESIDVEVSGGFSTIYEDVTDLPYYWYGASGSGDCSVVPFLMNGTNEVGWIFTPPTTTYGRLICTTDQDWIGAGFIYEESQLLMRNIIDHLDDYGLGTYTKNAVVTIADSVCSSVFPYVWNGLTIAEAGSYTFETTMADESCDSTITLEVFLLNNTTSLFDTICYGASYELGDSVFTTTGVHDVIFASSGECDSIVVVDLFVRPLKNFSYYDTVCAGGSYSFGSTMLNAAGSYADTLSAGDCDSIVTLHLWVKSYPIFSFTDDICAGDIYNFNGSLLTAAGIYHDTVTSMGCDSIVLLTLVANENLTYSFSDNICAGETYNFGGTWLSAGGTYIDTFSTLGCDSIVTLNLTVNDYITLSFAENLCAGDTYAFNGKTLTSSGIYTDTFSTTSCDSIVTLSLSIAPEITNSVAAFICYSEHYTWGDLVLLESGTYTQVFASATGCDSTVVLSLTVRPEIVNSVARSICFGTTYTWGEMVLAAAGSYTQVFSAASGCDSTVNLELAIHPEISTEVEDLICFATPYTWGGMDLSETGIYTQVFVGENGCDSTVKLSLTVKPRAASVATSVAGCDVVFFEGNSYVESTVLFDTLTDIDGCDSIYHTVDITINFPKKDSISASICKGESFKFSEMDLSLSGSYIDTFQTNQGCDSIVTLSLTVNPLPVIDIYQIPNEGGVCVYDSIIFQASGGETYSWYDELDTHIASGKDAKIVLRNYQNFVTVNGTDDNGCTDTASLKVIAQACCELLMPNAFSPNGDGINDRYGPATYGNPIEYQFQIYNRWGQRIFVSFVGANYWDGTIEGKPAPIGTYFYMLSGKCVSGEKLERKGDLTLIR